MVSAQRAGSHLTERRLVLLMLIILGQFALIKFAIHPAGAGSSRHAVPQDTFLLLLYFGLGLLLLLSMHLQNLWRKLLVYTEHYPWWRAVPLQVASYLLLVYSARKLLAPSSFLSAAEASGFDTLWAGLLIAGIFLTALSSLLVIAPRAYWNWLIRNEYLALALAPLFPISHLLVAFMARNSTDFLGIPTIKLSYFLLQFFYDNIQIDLQNRMLGTPEFGAIVDSLCAGYEGIGMMTVFLAWYLASFRKEVRFPAAFLLIPLGAAIIWLLNGLRIALIIAIGSSISPSVAMQGFHGNAGWINFIVASLCMVVIARGSSFFCRKPHRQRISVAADAENVFVLPFLVMLTATLLASAASADFQWLYPLRAIATGITIGLLWKRFELEISSPRLFPVLAGALVFLLWIALVSPSADEDRKFSENLFGVPTFLFASWIVVRLLGAIIIVPIAEELAFRRYVPALIAAPDDSGRLQWLPFIVSSVLFGALHTSWMAGAIAGAVYYLVRQRSGRLWDAIIAHMTTNLLLAGYVFVSGRWSYW